MNIKHYLISAAFLGVALAAYGQTTKPPIPNVAGPTTSDQLRSIITNETGTGSLVFGTNPTVASITTGGSTARTLQNHFADIINAEDFGASSSNPDNTTAINDAAAAISASGTKGGCIRLNAEKYDVAGTITLPTGVSLCGTQKGKIVAAPPVGTLLWGTGASGQIIVDVGNGSDNPNFNVVKDITFGFANAQSAGAAVRVRNGHTITLRDLVFGPNMYDPIVLLGGAGQYNYFLEDIEIGSGRRGVWIGGQVSSTPTPVLNVTMKNVTIGNTTEAGFYLQNVGGLQGCVGCETLNVGAGMIIAPGNGEKVDGVLWYGAFLDANTDGGLIIAPTGTACTMWESATPPLCGLASQLSFVNLRPSFSQAGPGVLIDSSGGGMVKGVSFTNLEAGLNFKDGVRVLGSNTSHIYLTNPKVSFNNVANDGGDQRPGIYFGAGVTNFSVVGGCSAACSQQFPGTINRQTWGVEIASGADYYSVTGVDLTGNATGAITFDTNYVNKSIMANIGATEQIIQGPARLIDTAQGDASLYINGTSNLNSGASIQLQGDGMTTPFKTMRAHQGALQIVNNAFDNYAARFSDTGTYTLGGATSATAVTTWPTNCTGLATGSLWNDSGTIKVCP